MKRIIIYIVAALAICGALYLTFGRKKVDPTAMTQYKLQAVEKGSVRKTVSSTGTLQPWTVVDIKSKAGGRVVAMLVDVGTPVTKGQVIARIDPADTLLAYDQAQSDVASAQARKEQNLRTHQLQIKQNRIAIANAEAALRSARDGKLAAQSRLDTARRQAKTQPTLTNTTIAQAKASLNQALKARAQLDATNKQQKASAQSSYDSAVANAKNAQANLSRQKSLLAKGFVSQQAVDSAQASHEVAQAQVESARVKLQTIQDELAATVESADARVAQARASLESAEAGTADIQTRKDAVYQAEAALRQAEAQVTQAQESLRQAKANLVNNEIRQLDIATAEATVTRSKASLKNATDALDQTTVRAPSEGVILQKYVDTGTIITSGMSLNSTGSSIVQMGDTTRMYVDVTVDEADIAQVDEGQKVDVTMDAYPDVPFEGVVARIDPRAIVESNVTTIHVRVEVDNSSPAFRLLKPGMNATCVFIVDEKEDALNVPSSAVQSDDKGSFVMIGSGGQPVPPDPAVGLQADPNTRYQVTLERRDVEVGVEGDETTEITKGVKEGELVVAQTIEPATTTASTNSPFGGGGPPGSGRRR